MRLRGRKGIRESLESQPELVVLDAAPHRGQWSQFFGNENPIYVELGMGKGRFISQMSARNPHINFIGVDMYDELLRRASEKARDAWREKGEETPPNLALLRANIEFIETMFAPGELERIYLNFSDPWPKSKHARRRLTHRRFVEKYMEILNLRGEIHFKTDSLSLFEFSLNSFADMELAMRNISLHLHRDEPREDLVFTEYEMKFMGRDQNIYRVEAVIGEEALESHRAAKGEAARNEAASAREADSDDDAEPAGNAEG